MAGKRQKVASYGPHVHFLVADALRGVHQHERAVLVSHVCDARHGVHRAGDVGDVRHGNERHPVLVEQAPKCS